MAKIITPPSLNKSASTATTYFFPAASGTVTSTDVDPSAFPVHRPQRALSDRAIANAVYAYIRAARSLGRSALNTADIADALSLPVHRINQAVSALRHKGVRIK